MTVQSDVCFWTQQEERERETWSETEDRLEKQ